MPARVSWAGRHFFALVLVGFLALQLSFWQQSKHIIPRLEIVPTAPGLRTIEAITFGDKQFFFRVLTSHIQNFGNTYGRFAPLYQYDFSKLYRWFLLADAMDRQSNVVPTLASYYFSLTQHKKDNIWVVRYLEQYTKGRIPEKWWWQAQAAYIAGHKLENKRWALKLALPLKNERHVPFWARQMAAFFYEEMGEFEAALAIMEHVKKHAEEIPQGELNFMRYFVEERLRALDQAHRERALHEFPPIKPLTSEQDATYDKGALSESHAPDKAAPPASPAPGNAAR